MKEVLIFCIKIYQSAISILLKNLLGIQGMCRYKETCSDFAIKSIERKGAYKGILATAKRIATCNPLTKNTYV